MSALGVKAVKLPPPAEPGRETWIVEGYQVSGVPYEHLLPLYDVDDHDLELRDGLYSSPIPRGDPVQVTGRHGSLPRTRLAYDVNTWQAQFWYLSSQWDLAFAEYEMLLRATNIAHRAARWERILASGRHQTYQGFVSQAMQPQALGQLGVRITCEVTSDGEPFWAEYAATTDQTATGVALPATLPLKSKALSSAPMTDLRFTITGPIDTPTVTLVSDAVLTDSFTYTGHIGPGQSLVVDSGTWQVIGGGGLVAVKSALTWTGNRYLEVWPAAPPNGVPTVVLSGANPGSGTSLSVSGRVKAMV